MCEILYVKILTPSGGVLIASPRRAGHSHRFDKYSTHHGPGAVGGGIGNAQCGSGRWVLIYEATLNDLVGWSYPFAWASDAVSAANMQNAILAWTGPNGVTYAFGEWLNSQGRGMVFDKVLTTDIDEWIGAH